jgi:CubicO group peptidase (beta-lactamase class C family)
MKPDLSSITLTRRQTLVGAAAIGAAATLPVTAWAQTPARWASVAQLLQGYVDSRKVAGMVAALGWRQQAPDVLAYGRDSFTGTRTSDIDSLYRVYSMTKPITGMAAMMLVDERKLSLDQPLADILPRFGNMKVQKVYDGPVTPDNLEPAARPITIRMLLTHTSGLSYVIVQKGPITELARDRGVVPGLVTRLQNSPAFRGTAVQGLKLFADRLAELPLVAQPGTRWSYSTGLDLMGRVIEVVSGQPFDRFLQQRIFDPVGMTSTFFRVPASEKGRLTTSYFKLDNLLVPIDLPDNSVFLDKPPMPFGGSGLVSSPRDYDRFLRMLVGLGQIDGKRVMSEAAVRMGTSNLLPDTVRQVPLTPGSLELDLAKYGFGAGGRVGKGADEGIYGWAGAAGTIAFADIKRGIRGGLFTQYMPSSLYPLDTEFPAAVVKDIALQLLRG